MDSNPVSSFATATTFSSNTDPLSLEPITDGEHIQIGRLVRAWAEIEDCLTLFIFGVSGLTETQGNSLLARTGWTRKLDIAEKLSEVGPLGATEAFKSVFDTGLNKIGKVRNAIAHGVYLGRRPDGAICFLTSDEVGPVEDGGRLMAVYALNRSAIQDMADALVTLLLDVASALQIVELRTARYKQSPRAHPKSQPKGPRTPKPKQPL